MITLVQGTLGGGKTLRCVRMLLDHIATGRYVYTNIDFVFSACREYVMAEHGVVIRKEQIRTLPPMEDVKAWVDVIEWGTESEPMLVVIDEAAVFWNSRDWADTQKTQRDMLSFLVQSRKAGVDVVFITQSVDNIDKQFRTLAQLMINCRNLATWKDPIFGRPLVGLFRYQTFEIAHAAGLKDNIISAEWWFCVGRRKLLFRCYRTHAFLDSYMTALAEKKKRLPPLKLKRVGFWKALQVEFSRGDKLEKLAARVIRPLVLRSHRRNRTFQRRTQVQRTPE